MARTCTVCTHAERAAIDRALVAGEPKRRIAAHFGLTEQALRRHRADHVAEELAAAKQAEDAAAADDLLAQVRDLQGHARTILTTSMTYTDFRMALAAIREARGCIELFVKIREAEEMEGRVAALEQQLAATAHRGVER